jgi:hypothetical protein
VESDFRRPAKCGKTPTSRVNKSFDADTAAKTGIDKNTARKSRTRAEKIDHAAMGRLTDLKASNAVRTATDLLYADKLTVGLVAVVAEHERDLISKRARHALQAAKAQGVKLGCRWRLRQIQQ